MNQTEIDKGYTTDARASEVPNKPSSMRVGLWRYQPTPLTQEQLNVGQYVMDVGWMVPDTRLRAIADAWVAWIAAGKPRRGHHTWIKLAKLLDALTLSAGTTPWPQWNTDALTEENKPSAT